MPYVTKTETVRVGTMDFQIRGLRDLNQGPDQSSELSAAGSGVSATNWPIFGVLWPSGRLLAEVIFAMDLTGLRILEVGCGLALAGLVAHRKGANITVSDHHPLAAEFLASNLALNQLPPLPYVEADWANEYPDLGRFDLIIGSDTLYDREHPALLSSFLLRHLQPSARVILTDPGRENYRLFNKRMLKEGFILTASQQRLYEEPENKAMCRILDYQRAAAAL